eukprot:TRINITY_DN2096_c0_g1_i1.p1 TRINITY_DN2096_c0_g1~~TRINITY_DN2096_c0_g1_i1.p1  ORF type:complete len:569 (+),score=110.04 TRINITY_DN2096_c0_g1_i1:66-1772(+)
MRELAVLLWAAAAGALSSGEGVREELRARGSLILPGGQGEVGLATDVSPFRAVWFRTRLPYAARPVCVAGLLPITPMVLTPRVRRWLGHADGTWSVELVLAAPWCHTSDPSLAGYVFDVPLLFATPSFLQKTPLPSPGELVETGFVGPAGLADGSAERVLCKAAGCAPGAIWEAETEPGAVRNALLPWRTAVVLAQVQSFDATQGETILKTAAACAGGSQTRFPCEPTAAARLGYSWSCVHIDKRAASLRLRLQGEQGLLAAQVSEELGYVVYRRGIQRPVIVTTSGFEGIQLSAAVKAIDANPVGWSTTGVSYAEMGQPLVSHVGGPFVFATMHADVPGGPRQVMVHNFSATGFNLTVGQNNCDGLGLSAGDGATVDLVVVTWNARTATQPVPTPTRTDTPTRTATPPRTQTTTVVPLCQQPVGTTFCGEDDSSSGLWMWLLVPLLLCPLLAIAVVMRPWRSGSAQPETNPEPEAAFPAIVLPDACEDLVVVVRKVPPQPSRISPPRRPPLQPLSSASRAVSPSRSDGGSTIATVSHATLPPPPSDYLGSRASAPRSAVGVSELIVF